MKIELKEYNETFEFQMTAETVEDAALLVRFGKSAKKEVKQIWCAVDKEKLYGGLVLPIAKNAVIDISR